MNFNNNNNSTKSVYLPGLNGLRAIAALAVVISHITLNLDEFGLNSKILGTDFKGNASGLSLAGFGVTIFFTLSGFLITYLLLEEKEENKINIKSFYIRRILRIWPLYYLYFVISLLTILYFGFSFNAVSVLFYIFLAANVPFILGDTLPYLAHYWSIGVEEQFYLFFPHLAKFSIKRLFNISKAIIFTFLFLKFIFWIFDREFDIHYPYLAISITRFHTMLVGVVAAILYYEKNVKFLFISTNKIAQISSWAILLLISLNKFHIATVIDNEIISILTVFLIMGQITNNKYAINLENFICDFIGKISYGIYIIHPLIIFTFSKFLGQFKSENLSNYILVYCLIISTTIIFAYLSYEFYEKRFLMMKQKYSKIKSLNSIHKL